MDFLKEYKVIALAIAFIIAVAANTLITAFVNDLLMPLITPFLPAGAWQTWQLVLGPFKFGIGAFIAAAINFIIVAFAVFLIAKAVLKEDKVAKK